jgi:hypothetical protein
MNLPRFSAEASLYKTTSYYQIGATSKEGGYLVHPALTGVRTPWCSKLNLACFNTCAKGCGLPPFGEVCREACENRCMFLAPCQGSGPGSGSGFPM